MQLRSLSQLNFRNLETPQLSFKPGITALVGCNASGKSNLLEAAYLGCTGELPGGRIVDLLRLGESEGFVGIRLEHEEGLSSIEIGLSAGKKTLRLDGQSVRAADIARVSAAVLITPQDTIMIQGPPSGRRAYLDSVLSKLSFRYNLMLREYHRVVEQRNALLKTVFDTHTLTAWTERFLELGTEITSMRQRAVQRISELSNQTYRHLAGDGKSLNVTLQTQSHGLRSAWEASRDEEKARGTTVVGPHRDDLRLELDAKSVQLYGSRGEARTSALALRVAEYQLLLEKHDEAPVLLLDDFSAELDSTRRTYLLELASNTPQAVVSGTEATPQHDTLLHIAGGEIYAE
ncbi:MAG: DNA replication and repair protein RecF [Trueperaceae bacterium]|nr:MAG: DNA replication and repair protein RecF [Trueperaceae bacterium]